MNVLLLGDPPRLRERRSSVPLAVPLINGYFADRGDVHITHRFVHDDGAIEGTADLDSFKNLIGYSCLVLEEGLPGVVARRERRETASAWAAPECTW